MDLREAIKGDIDDIIENPRMRGYGDYKAAEAQLLLLSRLEYHEANRISLRSRIVYRALMKKKFGPNKAAMLHSELEKMPEERRDEAFKEFYQKYFRVFRGIMDFGTNNYTISYMEEE